MLSHPPRSQALCLAAGHADELRRVAAVDQRVREAHRDRRAHRLLRRAEQLTARAAVLSATAVVRSAG